MYIKKLLTFLAVLLTALHASAYDFKEGGIYYNVISEQDMTCEVTSGISYYSGVVTIPSTVTYSVWTYSVTAIGGDAFRNSSGLTSVKIPNSVTSIGDYAFYYCSGLTSVEIPNSVTTIGDAAFSGCTGLTSFSGKFASEDHRYLIDDGVLNSFAPSGLTSYTIPNSVTTIGESAFYGCSGLTSVVIPNSVTTIGKSAFSDCSGLTSVEIPNSVTTIGDYAFDGCKGLTSVEIPNSVTEIGRYTFEHCSGLTSVVIPNSVTTIGQAAFYDCSSLESVVIPNSVTAIGQAAFYGCSGLTSVVIPNSVTTIGNHAFVGCSGLTSVEIPNSVTEIGDFAFYYCSGLTSVEIGNSVTTIGNCAFKYCSRLTEITSLNTTPPSVGSDCFDAVTKFNCELKVPNISIVDYWNANQWDDFSISRLNRSNDVSLSTPGLETLWLEYDAKIPEGVEVYYAEALEDSKVKMKKIEDVLPRETGVIVKGTAGETYSFLESDNEGSTVESLLVGSETEKTFGNDGYKYYKLTYNNDGENLGFYLANEDGTIEAKQNKAYLKLPQTSPSGAPTRGIGIDWDGGGTTEIESVTDFAEEDGSTFNLQGMRVGNGYKGLVIKNGKKIINK